jgi:drug/metabolite transporter (DMT)-like permease
MPANALALALAAAFLHAVWNLILARAPDTQAATAAAMVAAMVLWAPVAAATWRMEAAAVPYLAGSACLHGTYFVLLARAYDRAHMSLIYPLARGLAPVAVLPLAAIFGARVSGREAVGVLLVALGVLAVRGIGRRDAPASALMFALALALCTAAYTLVDRGGVQHAAPIAYLETMLLAPTLVYAAVIVRSRGAASLWQQPRVATLVASVGIFGAYALVLEALRLASAASVAAVRETSVVIGTALAALVLKEPVGRLRMGGAVLVAAGVALLA